MPPTNDSALLRQFAAENSETAFATLVERHISLVYSAALRQTSNPHSAEEVTQAVFIILARKAGSLGGKVVLPGWLYQTTRLTAANHLRTEIRRARREQEAHMDSVANQNEHSAEITWQQIAPVLETAMGGLNEADRNVILLRFFENKSMEEIAATLDASEIAVRKRVTRAVERLRKFFTKRGVMLTAAALAGAVSANSVQAAPVGLAAIVTATGVKGAAAGSSTLTLVNGALKFMAWTKAKMAIMTGVGLLLAAGTTTMVIQEAQYNRWRTDHVDPTLLNPGRVPPQVKILLTKFSETRGETPDGRSVPWGVSFEQLEGKTIGIGVELGFIAQALTGTHCSPARIIYPPGDWAARRFDVFANLPHGSQEALAREARKKLGIVARREVRETDVLLLKMHHTGAPGLKPGGTRDANAVSPAGKTGYSNEPLFYLVQGLEDNLHTPILDRTGLTNKYDLLYDNYQNKPDLQNVQRILLKDLGLELVPSREPIEMVVVEKVN